MKVLQILSGKKIELIFKRYKVVVAYAFGSRIENYANKNSDLDIAVLLPRGMNAQNRFKVRLSLIKELTKATQIECDVVVLNDVPSILMRFNVTSYGKPIYISDQVARLEYESRVMSEYFEFRPFLDQLNKIYVQENS